MASRPRLAGKARLRMCRSSVVINAGKLSACKISLAVECSKRVELVQS